MKEYYKIDPKYIQPLIDIPDGYFKIKGEYWAVEAISYFMDKKEQDTVIVKNNLKELIKKEKNIFEQCYKRFGKKEFPSGIIIRYGDKQQLKKDTLEGEEYVLSAFKGNKFWSKRFNDGYSLKQFLDETIENNTILNITLKNKQKNSIKLKLHYSTIFNGRTIPDSYIWWESETSYIESIINAIQNKIYRYDEYVERMEAVNQKFDKYLLIIYPQNIPIDVDEDELKKAIKKKFVDIKYDEIAIQLFQKLIKISNI